MQIFMLPSLLGHLRGFGTFLCSDVIIGLGKEVLEHLPGFVLHMCMCVRVCACVMTKKGAPCIGFDSC